MSIMRSCALFRGVSQDTLQRIEELVEKASYASGTFIFQGGEPADYFYILEEGRVRLRFSQGGQMAYALNEAGDVFGWSSMVNQAEYTLSAQSVSKVDVARVHRSRLSQVLEDDPRSGLIFYRHLADFIGQRLFNSYKATLSVQGERSSLSYG